MTTITTFPYAGSSLSFHVGQSIHGADARLRARDAMTAAAMTALTPAVAPVNPTAVKDGSKAPRPRGPEPV